MWKYLFKKVAGLQLYLKETPTRIFSREICENFKNNYFEEHLGTVASVIALFLT